MAPTFVGKVLALCEAGDEGMPHRHLGRVGVACGMEGDPRRAMASHAQGLNGKGAQRPILNGIPQPLPVLPALRRRRVHGAR